MLSAIVDGLFEQLAPLFEPLITVDVGIAPIHVAVVALLVLLLLDSTTEPHQFDGRNGTFPDRASHAFVSVNQSHRDITLSGRVAKNAQPPTMVLEGTTTHGTNGYRLGDDETPDTNHSDN